MGFDERAVADVWEHDGMTAADEPAVWPSPAVVVLVGPSGAGKTTWGRHRFGAGAVVSADALRALVGDGERDVRASGDAFDVLELAVARRVARRLTTVIDTLGSDADRRAAWRDLARRHDLACVAVVFDTPSAACRARNRSRRDPVPTQVLDGQLRQRRAVAAAVDAEGFDCVVHVSPADAGPGAGQRAATAPSTTAPSTGGRAFDDRPDAEAGELRFGLQVPSVAWAGGPAMIGPGLRRIAVEAEAAGFSSLWLMDHFRQIPMFGPPWHDMLESWTALAHLSGVTERVTLGTLVTGVTYRNVGHLAKIVATLDVLSGGRAVCGLGAAWYADEHRAYGYPFPPLDQRYALLEDALVALPLLWGAGNPPFDGRVVHLPDTTCYPRPLQARVPLLVGGNGERRTLALAARYADACNLIGDVDLVRRKVAVLDAHCRDAGRDRAAVRVTQLSTTLLGRTRDELDASIDRHRPPRSGPDRWSRQVNAATLDEHVTRFRALAAAGVQEAIVSLPDVGDPGALERFAALIAALRSG